jgi:hypothetical protein
MPAPPEVSLAAEAHATILEHGPGSDHKEPLQ